MISAIVEADKNWGIGKGSAPLTSIPDDEKYIASIAAENIIIMGRKTYERIPMNRLPLGRMNIVLSRNRNFAPGGAVCAHSIKEALSLVQMEGADAYVIGGSSVFDQMIDVCDEVQVTAIEYAYDADVHFPDLDKMVEWVMVSESEEQTHFDTIYHFRKYVRRKDYRM